MNVRRTLGVFASGTIVYGVVAACSAGGGAGGGEASRDAGFFDALVRDADALLDALVNPTPDANAGPLPPTVNVEACTLVVPYGGSNFLYAEHAYPGKTAVELSAVRAIVTYPAGSPSTASWPPGYLTYSGTPYVKDGAVAVSCGVQGGAVAQSATFVLP